MSIIYVLTTEAMPGLVKIGYTANLKIRLKKLDTTGLPLPFRCNFALQVPDSSRFETLLHEAFGNTRVRDNREFFEIEVSRVIAAMKLTGGKDVTPNDDITFDRESSLALEKKATRRKPDVNSDIVALETGTEIHFAEDKTITATVHGKWQILFEGEMSPMSKSAKDIFGRRGKNWKSVNDANYWCYDGETINERRNRLDTEAAAMEESD